MNILAVYHEPKSKYAYAYDKETLHIRIRTQKGDIDKIRLIAVDPFNWIRQEETDNYIFDYKTIQNLPMVKECTNEHFDFWFIEVKGFKWLRIKYAFVLEQGANRLFYGSHGEETYEEGSEKEGQLHNYFNFPFINEEDVYKAPSWAKDMIWYQIFPERFASGGQDGKPKGLAEWDSEQAVNNDKFFGGDLEGVINHLDYLKELGITGIYFTPIFESPSTHKYDTTNYFKIDTSFGSNKKFKELVEKAHQNGIRVMLDAVFNHCGFKHPFWQDVLKRGSASPYYECFHILQEPIINFELDSKGMPLPLSHEEQEHLGYRTFGFVPAMPKWNTNNPITKRHLLDVAKYWIKEYDIDGWRLDVSNEVSHDFWRDFRKEVRSVKEDVYIIGENWDNSYPWLLGEQFDAVMNYELLYDIWNFIGEEAYSYKKMNALQYKDAISTLLSSYPKNALENMFNMLDSHDTARLLTVCEKNVKKAKLAYVLQMTFAGAPSIYYGSEVGLVGEGEDSRRCMPWTEEKQNIELKQHVAKLIAIRKELASTKATAIEWLAIDDKKNYIIFKKCAPEERLYVLINNGEEKATIILPEELMKVTVRDVYNECLMPLDTTIELEPSTFRLWLA